MVSFATAAVLVGVYNLHPGWPFRALFAWTHRVSGVCLATLPLWVAFKHRRAGRLYAENIRHVWSWGLADLKWLALIGPATVSARITLPDQGKFNAAEKINFMVLMSTYPLYLVTGLLIWLPGADLLSWLAHFSMAMFAMPLMLGHIFMATVNPDTRVGLSGMLSGFVARDWAKHHYRLWYAATFEQGADETAPAPPVEVTFERPAPALDSLDLVPGE